MMKKFFTKSKNKDSSSWIIKKKNHQENDILTGKAKVLQVSNAAEDFQEETPVEPLEKEEKNLYYIKRVPGITLKEVLEKLQANEELIRELDLTEMAQKGRVLGAEAGILLARVFQMNYTVRKLILKDHEIGDKGAQAIADMLRVNMTIEHLDLYGNSINDEGAIVIAQAIYGHESLKFLGLQSNQIGDKGAMALANALEYNRTLEQLALVHNQIATEGAQALIQAIEKNSTIQVVNVALNRNISSSLVSQMNQALAMSKIRKVQIDKTAETVMALVMDEEEQVEIYESEGESSDDEEDEEEEEVEDGSEWI